MPVEEVPVELTEEELEQKRQQEEEEAINANFENYSNLDANAESMKLQEKQMAKNKKKAVSQSVLDRRIIAHHLHYFCCLVGDSPPRASSTSF